MLTKRTPPIPTIVLSPGLRYLLLTGRNPEQRLHGWVAVAMTPVGEIDRLIHNAWAEHGEALQLEAEAAGFEPFALHQQRPKGAAFEQWRSAFVNAHSY